MTDETDPGVPDVPGMPAGSLSEAISTAIVGLLRKYTGRAPTHAHTTIASDMIVVTLRDCLTRAERTLAAHGQAQQALAMRHAFRDVMRDELIAVVEALTGRTVEAFLSDNLDDPDIAVEVFVMHDSANGGTRLT